MNKLESWWSHRKKHTDTKVMKDSWWYNTKLTYLLGRQQTGSLLSYPPETFNDHFELVQGSRSQIVQKMN